MKRLFNWSWTRKLLKKRENVEKEEEEGPINRLPNELIQLILAKLELDYDVRKLVQLRLVSTRWKAVVENYCAQKKSLIVVMRETNQRTWNIPYLEERYPGFVKSKNFACLYLSFKTPRKRLRSILNLFTNNLQLAVDCEDRTRLCDFVVYINSLGSLNQLELVGPFLSALPSYSPKLSKLEGFSHFCHKWKDSEHHQLISILKSNCVRFGGITYDLVCQWHNINPNWLTNLTHLEIFFGNARMENSQVVHYLGEHATSLRHLNIYFWHSKVGLVLTPTVIRDLSKRIYLSKLELRNIRIDIHELEQEAKQNELISLSSVSTCKLYGTVVSDHGGKVSADQFIRVLWIILPNLLELNLGIGDEFIRPRTRPQIDGHFRDEIEHCLCRTFPDLNKHKFVFY